MDKMFAIVETGGKQYKVAPNMTIKVEKLTGDEGSKIILDNVLLLQKEDGKVEIGQPTLKNVKVEATITKTFKGEKVIDFIKRRRKNSRRKNGHRQTLTELKIVAVNY